ncbi:sarcosine oxidase subunit gamma [Paracoccus denitrificans]|jgi:sarcosine oxidase subunit gamma|uniref:Sarcosine oxidase, gamma subunit n=1 Tax=Paracoccus denitrificans (strain Pd 1222) TaxID=318586 RepID=A1AZD4_PARDP|nr:sarcosine oxidase subunit gamma family protein [Paracoccus denitrificans]ABL68628.1 Sarcosine oxidase, gamma subunit [Paracoccus denitrificans PD1222]MBB4625647.1 sarcosine oxidase subunit gamma [Paracoccus denitrificans]MCU7427184.1 sarcosine oxidase subunit gamma [Paracoccus denitrificans]QAR26687.1 sarcosine oxidase subunit gamma [Paracoccus denitrificans]UFS64020.1 sarcosine oxidase subunit gamma [Paracoccus denitrificans]
MAEALARISQVQDWGMIQIRADLSRAGDAIAEAAGVALPGQGRITTDGSRTLGWMSPDELLLVLPRAETAEALAALQDALATEHALVLDVSDMRAVFRIQGAKALDVLMKLCPADLAAMPQDGLRRTRAAQVACGIWRETDGYVLIGFRSVTDYLRGILTGAAVPGTQLDPR